MIFMKDELVNKLNAEKGYTKRDAGMVIDDVFRTITEILAGGDSVQIHGFGKFDVRERQCKEMIDYNSKERIVVPSYKAPFFSAGESLKRAIKEGYLRE